MGKRQTSALSLFRFVLYRNTWRDLARCVTSISTGLFRMCFSITSKINPWMLVEIFRTCDLSSLCRFQVFFTLQLYLCNPSQWTLNLHLSVIALNYREKVMQCKLFKLIFTQCPSGGFVHLIDASFKRFLGIVSNSSETEGCMKICKLQKFEKLGFKLARILPPSLLLQLRRCSLFPSLLPRYWPSLPRPFVS